MFIEYVRKAVVKARCFIVVNDNINSILYSFILDCDKTNHLHPVNMDKRSTQGNFLCFYLVVCMQQHEHGKFHLVTDGDQGAILLS